MAVADTIKILIEADSTGLETQLKRATDTVVSTVDKMNSQQVNWETIMAKTISPTLIAGVAAVFAQSIAQFASFQNAAVNLNNIGGQATNSFANSLKNTSGQAYQLASSAGRSISDTATAYEGFMKAGLTSAAAQKAVTQSSLIAYNTQQPYLQVVDELITLFQNWGVTTLPQTTQALNGLVDAAGHGKFTLQELISTVGKSGVLLKGSTDITNIAESLAHMTTEGHQSKTAVEQMFQAFLNGYSDTSSNLNVFLGGMNKIKSELGKKGLIPIFEQITQKVRSFGNNTGIAGRALGISAELATIFGKTAPKAETNAATAAKKASDNIGKMHDSIKITLSPSEQLAKNFNTFMSTVESFVLPPAIKELNAVFSELNDLMTGGSKTASAFKAGPTSFVSNFLESLTGGLGSGGPLGAVNLPGMIGNLLNHPKQNQTSTSMNTVTNNVTVHGTTTNPHQLAGSITDKLLHNKMYGLSA